MKATGAPRESALYAKRHGAATARDWARVGQFASVIARVPGLRTARPVACDTQQGEIHYERLPDPRPISTLDAASLGPTLRETGRLLAAFHTAGVQLEAAPGTSEHSLDGFGLTAGDLECLRTLLPCGFFWGDCWQGNVLLVDGRIFFIDPLPNRWLFDVTAVRANGALDLAMLYMSVYFCHPLRRLLSLDTNAAVAAAEGLLDAYLSAFDAAAAARGVRRLARALAVRHIAASRDRLALPIAFARQLASGRILNQLDDILAWR